MIAALALSLAAPLQAQVQRSFVNLGFESPNLEQAGCRVYIDHALVPGWTTDHPDYGQQNVGGCTVPPGFVDGQPAPIVELWDTPRSGVNAREGTQLAELNAEEESSLSQSVCLVNGEQLQWEFSHRGRESVSNEDVMELLVGGDPVVRVGTTSNGAGGVIDTYSGSATSTPGPNAGGWRDYSGSFTYNGASGLVDIGFEAISTGGNNITSGNFLDRIQVTLAPNLELSSGAFTSPEGDNSTGLPALAVTGNLIEDLDITLQVVGGSADLGDDFTTPGGGSSFTVTIPAGNYDGTTAVPLGVASIEDTIAEGDETVEFEISAGAGGYNLSSTTSCGGAATTTASWTIEDATTGLVLDKQLIAAPDPIVAGSLLEYRITATNTGGAPLSNVLVSDDLTGDSHTCPTVAVGDSCQLDASYTASQSDVDNGEIVNSASAEATDPGGDPVTAPPASVTTEVPAAPALSLNKTAGPPSGNSAGDTIDYTFIVTNSGNVTIDGIAIDDSQLDAAASCDVTSLAPDATATCGGTHTIIQTEVDAGGVDNAATATGTDPGGDPVEASDSTSTPLSAAASLNLDKVAGTPSGHGAGDTIDYTFTVTNSGNVTLDGLAIDDSQLDAGASCDVTTLAPASTATCSGTHTITQAEVDAGQVDNTATVNATDPGGDTVSADDSTSTPLNAAASLNLDKVAGTPSGNSADDTIDYTFTVTNSGNVTLDGLAIDDSQLDAGATCDATTLAPDATTTCGGTHTITQAEVDAGSVDNTATANATAPGGDPVDASDSTSTALTAAPALELSKTGSAGGNSAGDTVDYTFAVTNSGNVTLDGLAIDDPLLDAPATCDTTTLAPNVTVTCSGSYTITQAEVDAGEVNNTATASATDPGGNPVSAEDSDSVALAAAPSLSLAKVAGAPSGQGAGDSIDYTFTATNTGNVTLDGLAIDDPQLDAAASCDVTTLAPGVSASCSGSHTITQAEVDAGEVNNTATAEATDPGGNPLTAEDSVSVALNAASSLNLAKVAGAPSGNRAGDTIAYSFTVTNTGNTTVDGIVIEDPQLDATASCDATTLAPGASASCSGSHTITQEEVDAGSVDNAATVTGSDPGGNSVSADDSTSTALVASPALDLSKAAGPPSGNSAGDTVEYTFTVTNSGNVTIDGIAIDDPQLDVAANCDTTTLAPGASASCSGSHSITQAEVDAGRVENTATANGTDPGGNTVSATDSATATLSAAPALSLEKTALESGYAGVGDTLNYRYRVTNSGNVTVDEIAVSDDKIPSVDCPQGPLAPGKSTTCSGSYSATQADLDAGSVTNLASATGTPAGGTLTPAEDSETVDAAPNEIDASDDRYGPVNGASGAAELGSVFDNDSLNGQPLDPAAVTATPLDTPPPELTFDATTGAVGAVPGTPAGDYGFRYRICENANSANCATAAVSVTVVAPDIDAADDDFSAAPINGADGGSTPPVTANDTLNGEPLQADAIELEALEVPGELTLNPDGSIAVAPDTAAGRYQLRYRICEIANPDNCDTATAEVLVEAAQIVAEDDDYSASAIRGADGGRTPPVLGNDSLNGAAADIAAVDIVAEALPEGLNLNGDGSISVAAGTAGGSYTLEYRLCERLNPGNCDSAQVLLRVEEGMPLRLRKQTATRQVRVGDLIRYQLTAENIGEGPVRDFTLVDTPPPGFSLVADSLRLSGAGGGASLAGGNPIRIRGASLAAGDSLSVSYLLRVGPGAVRGEFVNSAVAERGGNVISNTARASAYLVADALLEETRIFGTVFNDRDGDGWQDSDEAGLPGVRLATIEGLIVETDAYGRYHLEGIDVANFARGRNFTVKVDTASLPEGSEVTTPNPLIKRVTQGLPVGFDFGVGAPGQPLQRSGETVEMAVGEVLFEAGSARIASRHRPALEKMVAQLREYRGGELVITGHAEAGALAMARAQSLRQALLAELSPELRERVNVELRSRVDAEMLARLDGGVKLGTLLFDTDSAEIRPDYRDLIRTLAGQIEARGGGWITIVGHTDRRASAEYNRRLGLRRARAVYDAIAAEIAPETRAHLRVEVDDGKAVADREVQP
ncbi:DUF7507 domain-containing protein [Microbulbifer halophilus]|uniref:OmpA family protein n=1 Tax=Microbulbifer halophilus TaxID=453963 RepID=A0ABW5EGM3_9GAMM